jgi:hypothetical protein
MVKKAATGFVAIILIVCALAVIRIDTIGSTFKPSLFKPYFIRSDNRHGIKITFLGTSCFIIDYKGKQIVTDPFFSNPGLFKSTIGKIEYPVLSNRIDRSMYDRVQLISISHGHYDHCLDLANFMNEDNAVLADESTLNEVAPVIHAHPQFRNENEQWIYSKDSTFRIFPLTSVHTPHFASLTLFTGRYTQPLKKLPGRLWNWKLYRCSSYLIDVLDGDAVQYRILEANGKMDENGKALLRKLIRKRNADLLLSAFWSASVCEDNLKLCCRLAHPEKVILQHWNNFFIGPDQPLQYLKSTEFPESIEKLKKDGIEAGLMLPFSTVAL